MQLPSIVLPRCDRPLTILISMRPDGETLIRMTPGDDSDVDGPTAREGESEVPAPTPTAPSRREDDRLPGETDLAFTVRLRQLRPDLELLVRDWAALLKSVARRELVGAKGFGQLASRRRERTRGGNGLLVHVDQIVALLTTFDQVERLGAVPPAWYASVRTPSKQPSTNFRRAA